MSYIFCIALFLIGCYKVEAAYIIAASIFAVAGSIEVLATKFTKK